MPGITQTVIPPEITSLYPTLKQALVAEIARLTAKTAPVVVEIHRYDWEECTDFWNERKVSFFRQKAQVAKLVECRDAIERLKDGTFGICCTCGNLIEEGRLIAYPHARNCRDCQEKKPIKIW